MHALDALCVRYAEAAEREERLALRLANSETEVQQLQEAMRRMVPGEQVFIALFVYGLESFLWSRERTTLEQATVSSLALLQETFVGCIVYYCFCVNPDPMTRSLIYYNCYTKFVREK